MDGRCTLSETRCLRPRPPRPKKEKKKEKKKKYARSSILYLALIPVPLWQGPLILQPPDNLPRYLLTVTNGVCHYTRMCVCVCVACAYLFSSRTRSPSCSVCVVNCMHTRDRHCRPPAWAGVMYVHRRCSCMVWSVCNSLPPAFCPMHSMPLPLRGTAPAAPLLI